MGGTCVEADVWVVAGVGESVAYEFWEDGVGWMGDFSGERGNGSCELLERKRGRKLRSMLAGFRGEGPRISSASFWLWGILSSNEACGAEKIRRFACGLCARSAERD